MTINERINDLLKEMNITQKELAESIGVSQNTISDWINKGKNPSANLMYRISDFLNISFDYLFTGFESKSMCSLDTTNIPSLSSEESDLLDLYHQLSHDAQRECIGYIKGYLAAEERTHMEPRNQRKNA